MFQSRLQSLLLLIVSLLASASLAQDAPVPTLQAPTLLPVVPTATPDSQPSRSAVADIIATGVFRVGVLYNDPPYSQLTLQGELGGFDADLLRKLAAVWESEIEFVQVTRVNALERLNSGEVHAVASAFTHYRDLASQVDFSQTYLRGKQGLMVLAGSSISAPSDLGDEIIGFVLGSRGEKALAIWQERHRRSLNLQAYLTLDRAAVAVTRGEIAGLVAEEQALLRAAADLDEELVTLDEPVIRESHALAVRRQDAPMRLLLNRALQFLASEGELDTLYREHFPGANHNTDALPLWSGIGEAVSPADFSGEIDYPASYALPAIKARGSLRVGGLVDVSQAASDAERRLAQLNRALATEIASRWGLALELIPSDVAAAAQSINGGTVDMVAGVKPDWARASQIDFSAPYLLHGDRLMVRANSGIAGFNNLRGRIVGILLGANDARARAQAWADSINASVRFYQTTESGAALTLLEHNNANAIYADSLSLLAHLEANPEALRLTDRWYSRSYYAFALPYNDPDLRLLLNYTLQELVSDGSLLRMTAPLMASDDLPDFDVAPGFAHFAGFEIASAAA